MIKLCSGRDWLPAAAADGQGGGSLYNLRDLEHAMQTIDNTCSLNFRLRSLDNLCSCSGSLLAAIW